jgi:hypothetical protein
MTRMNDLCLVTDVVSLDAVLFWIHTVYHSLYLVHLVFFQSLLLPMLATLTLLVHRFAPSYVDLQ